MTMGGGVPVDAGVVDAGGVVVGAVEPAADLVLRAQGGRSDCDACAFGKAPALARTMATEKIARSDRQSGSARRVEESVGRMRY